MRAFNKNPNYLSVTPDITWDDSFVPSELYDDIETELANLEDAKESQKKKKKEEGQMAAKEKAKATQIDNGKGKETSAQDEENPDDTENPKRKKTQKTSESSLFGDIDEDGGTSADEAAEPPTKRVKRKNSIDDVENMVTIPPPCRRCNMLEIECVSIGLDPACEICVKARLPCSLSNVQRPLPSKSDVIPNTTGDEEKKARVKRNDKGKEKETVPVEDKEKSDDTEKPPKTWSHREIHYALSKSIPELDDRSLIEDEDVDQLDSPTMTTIDVFIPNDPKVRLVGNSSFLHVGKFDTCESVRSLRTVPQRMCS
jgi:hypothetical protein